MNTRALESGTKFYAVELVQGKSVCLSPVFPDRSSTSQSSLRSSRKNASDNPMTNPTMVSPIAGNIDKEPLFLFKGKNLLKNSLGKEYSIVEENILRIMVQKSFGNSYILIFL